MKLHGYLTLLHFREVRLGDSILPLKTLLLQHRCRIDHKVFIERWLLLKDFKLITYVSSLLLVIFGDIWLVRASSRVLVAIHLLADHARVWASPPKRCIKRLFVVYALISLWFGWLQSVNKIVLHATITAIIWNIRHALVPLVPIFASTQLFLDRTGGGRHMSLYRLMAAPHSFLNLLFDLFPGFRW